MKTDAFLESLNRETAARVAPHRERLRAAVDAGLADPGNAAEELMVIEEAAFDAVLEDNGLNYHSYMNYVKALNR